MFRDLFQMALQFWLSNNCHNDRDTFFCNFPQVESPVHFTLLLKTRIFSAFSEGSAGQRTQDRFSYKSLAAAGQERMLWSSEADHVKQRMFVFPASLQVFPLSDCHWHCMAGSNNKASQAYIHFVIQKPNYGDKACQANGTEEKARGRIPPC